MPGIRKYCLVVVLPILILMNGCAIISGVQAEEDRDTKIAETNLSLGIGYMKQGKLDDALEKLLKAEDAKPGDAAVHSVLALVYDQMQEYDKADRHYRRAIDLNAEEGGYYNNYGAFLCRHGKYQEADKYFNKAVNTLRYKTPESALENAGVCAAQIPNAEKAEDYLRKALSINDKLPVALAEMADLMFKKQNYLSTRAYLQRFGEVSKPTARSLWLGIRTERKLGDKEAEARYAKLLQSQYPDSLEFKRWLKETP